MVNNKTPVIGSLVRAEMNDQGHDYDLWAIVTETPGEGDSIQGSVVEVVPWDHKKWTRRGMEPREAGSTVSIPVESIKLVIHPRRRMTRAAKPQFLMKLNGGRISDIYSIGKSTAVIRMVDLATYYMDEESRREFHKDVMITSRGAVPLD